MAQEGRPLRYVHLKAAHAKLEEEVAELRVALVKARARPRPEEPDHTNLTDDDQVMLDTIWEVFTGINEGARSLPNYITELFNVIGGLRGRIAEVDDRIAEADNKARVATNACVRIDDRWKADVNRFIKALFRAMDGKQVNLAALLKGLSSDSAITLQRALEDRSRQKGR